MKYQNDNNPWLPVGIAVGMLGIAVAVVSLVLSYLALTSFYHSWQEAQSSPTTSTASPSESETESPDPSSSSTSLTAADAALVERLRPLADGYDPDTCASYTPYSSQVAAVASVVCVASSPDLDYQIRFTQPAAGYDAQALTEQLTSGMEDPDGVCGEDITTGVNSWTNDGATVGTVFCYDDLPADDTTRYTYVWYDTDANVIADITDHDPAVIEEWWDEHCDVVRF